MLYHYLGYISDILHALLAFIGLQTVNWHCVTALLNLILLLDAASGDTAKETSTIRILQYKLHFSF